MTLPFRSSVKKPGPQAWEGDIAEANSTTFVLNPEHLATMTNESLPVSERISAMCAYLQMVTQNKTIHNEAISAIASVRPLITYDKVAFAPAFCELLKSLCTLDDSLLISVIPALSPVVFMKAILTMFSSDYIPLPAAFAIADSAWKLINNNPQTVLHEGSLLYEILTRLQRHRLDPSQNNPQIANEHKSLILSAIRSRQSLILMYEMTDKYELLKDEMIRFFKKTRAEFSAGTLDQDLLLLMLKSIGKFLETEMAELVRVDDVIDPLCFFAFQSPAKVALRSLKALLLFCESAQPIVAAQIARNQGFLAVNPGQFAMPGLDRAKWIRMYSSVWGNVIQGLFPETVNAIFLTVVRQAQAKMKGKITEIVQAFAPGLNDDADYAFRAGATKVIVALLNTGDSSITGDCLNCLAQLQVSLVDLLVTPLSSLPIEEIVRAMKAIMVIYNSQAAHGALSSFVEELGSTESLAVLQESMSVMDHQIPQDQFSVFEQFVSHLTDGA